MNPASATGLNRVTLDDKFRPDVERVYLNGTQALVRLLLVQRARDRAAGLSTGGFVSGYRGSPLGGFDRELWRAQSHLDAHDVHFWPGVNEDLAATAVWGSQMTALHGEATVDGVFGMWYGKGAGLDRSGDAMRHAAASGVNPHGGVLAVVGDDHAQKSSTHAYYSEPTFADLLIPVLYPADVGELLTFGVLGWAMSRFSGAWVGLKTSAEVLECSTSIVDDSATMSVRAPAECAPPRGAVHLRWPDPWLESEVRWIDHRLPAIHAFARANGIDRSIVANRGASLGIVTAGKSYRDLLQALDDLHIALPELESLGVAIYKVGVTWPLEREGLRRFAAGLREILVIEEKRPTLEDQVRSTLFDSSARPIVTGKKDLQGAWQFPWIGEFGANRIAQVLAAKLGEARLKPQALTRLAELSQQPAAIVSPRPTLARPPYFCSGCPHNTSTRVPDGSRAIAGVGCHYMAVDMERSTTTFSQMGGEGATWIGQAPFSRAPHVFVNLGEGTYFHSGSLAVRACIAAGVNITYKLLYNDAVAMTGGQPVDGQLTVAQLAHQLHAEGVRTIRIVAEEPKHHRPVAQFPPGTTLHERGELDAVQRELREMPGVTALIYDQTCAAEKRRRRKRGQMLDPARRVFINAAVCEGCGDCSKTSNCLSVVPLDTELGRKRAIDQSSCNKDQSCVDGFCPSFVTVIGGTRRAPQSAGTQAPPHRSSIPEPALPRIADTWDIFITGMGGTGVVTIGALVGMAAHVEGKSCSVLDQLGMAQKGGAVVSHVRIAPTGVAIRAPRVRTAGADVLLGLDLAVALQDSAFDKLSPRRTRALLNTHESITGAFTRAPDLVQPTAAMVEAIVSRIGAERVEAFDATRLATAQQGDSIATNVFVLGYAWQRGLVPLTRESVVEAIRLNAVDVAANIGVFEAGRAAAIERQPGRGRGSTTGVIAPADAAYTTDAAGLDALIELRTALLREYQDDAYARTYADFVATVRATEAARVGGGTALSEAVARSLFKLMAYKDEYEVARLFTSGAFLREINENFAGDFHLVFHMAPPLLAGRDRATGQPRKRAFGPWLYGPMRVLARMRRLRGTRLDPFGYTHERRRERELISEYRGLIGQVLGQLTPERHPIAVQLAELPLAMRGFGHVKQANVAAAREKQAELLAAFAAAG